MKVKLIIIPKMMVSMIGNLEEMVDRGRDQMTHTVRMIRINEGVEVEVTAEIGIVDEEIVVIEVNEIAGEATVETGINEIVDEVIVETGINEIAEEATVETEKRLVETQSLNYTLFMMAKSPILWILAVSWS